MSQVAINLGDLELELRVSKYIASCHAHRSSHPEADPVALGVSKAFKSLTGCGRRLPRGPVWSSSVSTLSTRICATCSAILSISERREEPSEVFLSRDRSVLRKSKRFNREEPETYEQLAAILNPDPLDG